MKRLISMLLALAVLLLPAGCGWDAGDNTVPFYYLRRDSEFVYGAEDGVIAPENREVSDRSAGLSYLLRLYLEGPLDSTLRSPFPAGTKLLRAESVEGTVTLELSKEFTALEDMDLTLAYACLATTVFQLTGAEQVHITAVSQQGVSKSITLFPDSLTLLDGSEADTEAITSTEQ